MNLFDIGKAIEDILNQGLVYDEETGEVFFDENDLDKLNQMETEKLESIGMYIKNENAMATAIKAELDSLTKRKKAHEAKVDWLKKYVSSYLESKGMEKGYETPKVKFSFRKSPALNVYDAVSLRKYIDEDEDRKKKYYKYSEPEISKKAITDDLKADENLTIPGAEIISKKNLQIK